MARKLNRGWMAAALLGLSACGAGNDLSGSLSEVLSLGFDEADVQLSGEALAISYLKKQGAGKDTVFKLAVSLQGLDLSRAGSVDLAAPLDNGQPRASCSRAVADDSRHLLPAIARGKLLLDSPAAAGKTLSGSFNLLFVQVGPGVDPSQTGQAGAGRTAMGSFKAVIRSL